MSIINNEFGYSVYGETIGLMWIDLLIAIAENGEVTFDEGRKRLSLQNVRVKSFTSSGTDSVIERFADTENIDKILSLTFDEEVMKDIDITPSFKVGSKSYFARINDWEMLDFVVERLIKIPESKKAVISFIRKSDYESILENPYDDYLPCITTVQFRLIKNDAHDSYTLNIIFNARSIDAFQKSVGNFIAIAKMSEIVAKRIEIVLKTKINLGSLDGMITDAHIYSNTLDAAKDLILKYKNY